MLFAQINVDLKPSKHDYMREFRMDVPEFNDPERNISTFVYKSVKQRYAVDRDTGERIRESDEILNEIKVSKTWYEKWEVDYKDHKVYVEHLLRWFVFVSGVTLLIEACLLLMYEEFLWISSLVVIGICIQMPFILNSIGLESIIIVWVLMMVIPTLLMCMFLIYHRYFSHLML